MDISHYSGMTIRAHLIIQGSTASFSAEYGTRDVVNTVPQGKIVGVSVPVRKFRQYPGCCTVILLLLVILPHDIPATGYTVKRDES